MFKNVTVYRIAPDWQASAAQLEAALEPARFVPCGASQAQSVGWVEPRGQAHGPLVEAVAGHWLMKLMIETKAVPGAVVRRKAQETMADIEATTGRKPGKKEARAIRDDALLALLPQAFPKQSSVLVWLDPQARWLVTDAGSQGKADEVLTALVRALDGLAPALVQTELTPQTAMAQWLTAPDDDALPAAFAVLHDCELKSGDEPQSVVKFTRHNLATDEVRQHIAQGKLPTLLALNWEGRVSFVLTATMQLKKIAFDDGVFEATSGDKEDGFDADAALATGELGRLIPDLIEALGGELSFTDAAAPVPPAMAASASARQATATTGATDDDPPF